MTASLTERLQQRLSDQTAEIEALTSAELTRLASSLRQQSEAALRTMRSDIQDTSTMMADELEIMRWTARWKLAPTAGRCCSRSPPSVARSTA